MKQYVEMLVCRLEVLYEKKASLTEEEQRVYRHTAAALDELLYYELIPEWLDYPGGTRNAAASILSYVFEDYQVGKIWDCYGWAAWVTTKEEQC